MFTMNKLLLLSLLPAAVSAAWGYNSQRSDPTIVSTMPGAFTRSLPADILNELKPIRAADILVGQQVASQFDKFHDWDQVLQTLQSASPPLANLVKQETIGINNALGQLKMKSSLDTQIYMNGLQKLGKGFFLKTNAEYLKLNGTTKSELQKAFPNLSHYLGSPISQWTLFDKLATGASGSPSILPTQYAQKQNAALNGQSSAETNQMQSMFGNQMGWNNRFMG